MEQRKSRFLMNQVAIFQYGVNAFFILFIIVLFLLFTSPLDSTSYRIMAFLILMIIVDVLREICGFRLTNENTIESYCLLWRAKKKSIDINSILALQEVTPKKLMIEYQKEEKGLPSYTSYLLKSDDIQYLKSELLKRNPSIEIINNP